MSAEHPTTPRPARQTWAAMVGIDDGREPWAYTIAAREFPTRARAKQWAEQTIRSPRVLDQLRATPEDGNPPLLVATLEAVSYRPLTFPTRPTGWSRTPTASRSTAPRRPRTCAPTTPPSSGTSPSAAKGVAAVSAEHPSQVPGSGVALSPAEADRLGKVLGTAGHTLAADDDALPAGQRAAQPTLAVRLDQAADDLTRRMLRARQASVRLDAPVRLDPGQSARVLGLLDQAASRLDELADRREAQPYLVGPDYFRQQASAARAWHADLGELAVRQADRCHPTRERAEQDREDGHER